MFLFSVFCRTIAKRLKSAMCWVLVTAIVCALLLGILYGKLRVTLCVDETC